ncbi:MAG: ribonuclease HIII [Verrucomicrobia bacterium]|nr:MAG: ribonuclease HIII [Verrucomicrobiota bacterium]
MKRTSFTFPLTAAQCGNIRQIISNGNYRPRAVPHAELAAEGRDCQITLYNSGKLLVQGSGAADWITFVLEPEVLGAAHLGYEAVLDPAAIAPHMGVDESGKGDFFGPLVIAAAYVDPQLAAAFRELNVRDSKTISSDRLAEKMADDIRRLLGHRFSLVVIGPGAYNRLYAKIGNVNRLLAWGHARAIENLLAEVPNCPRALSDQFGPQHRIEHALKQRGLTIKLDQRHKAESDPAVAAASVLARAGFLKGLRELGQRYDLTLPKGASDKVQDVARQFVKKHGPTALNEVVKCHFKTTDTVLGDLGLDRHALAQPAVSQNDGAEEL